jgi:hypothetical protein
VGTRDRIISYLGSVTDISDPGGMASTRLAEAVGYPGSSVAFAQLLSGMERDGLISREVRGKRTYRIVLAPGVQPGRIRSAAIASGAIPGNGLADNGVLGRGHSAAASDAFTGVLAAAGGVVSAAHGNGLPMTSAPRFDYDELARRLLIQVIRRLATPPEGHEDVVADLERELVAARSRASTLNAENLALREQLSQVRHRLDEASRSLDGSALGLAGEPELSPAGPVGEELSHAEVVLLERLIAPASDTVVNDGIQRDATAS